MINEEVNQEGVDLNFPPPLDLGGLEDLAQGVDDFVDEEILDDRVQVIADDDLIIEEPLQEDIIINDLNVNVFILMENGQ